MRRNSLETRGKTAIVCGVVAINVSRMTSTMVGAEMIVRKYKTLVKHKYYIDRSFRLCKYKKMILVILLVKKPVSYTHLRAPRDRTRSRMPSSA